MDNNTALLDCSANNTKMQQTYITNLDVEFFINKTKEVNIGNIIIHKNMNGINTVYAYNGIDRLIKLDNDYNNSIHKEKIKMIPKICKCCGASMNNSNICEYCGVNYK